MSGKLSKAEGLRFVAWCKRALNLEDWTITLWIQGEPPEWATGYPDAYGLTAVSEQWKRAMIWLVPRAQECQDGRIVEPLNMLAHEMGHVLAADLDWETSAEPAPRKNEQVWNAIGDVLVAAFEAGLLQS